MTRVEHVEVPGGPFRFQIRRWDVVYVKPKLTDVTANFQDNFGYSFAPPGVPRAPADQRVRSDGTIAFSFDVAPTGITAATEVVACWDVRNNRGNVWPTSAPGACPDT